MRQERPGANSSRASTGRASAARIANCAQTPPTSSEREPAKSAKRGPAAEDAQAALIGAVFGRLLYWRRSWASGPSSVLAASSPIAPPAPQIDQLAVPKRPPNIAILADDGTSSPIAATRAARRCGSSTAALSAEGLHRHRGSPLLFACGHRSVGIARAFLRDIAAAARSRAARP